MSFFRRLSNLSKRDSRSNFKTINSTPPTKTTSPIEEEKRDIGSNEEDSIYTARLDDEESSNDAVPRMTSCFGSEIGTGRSLQHFAILSGVLICSCYVSFSGDQLVPRSDY